MITQYLTLEEQELYKHLQAKKRTKEIVKQKREELEQALQEHRKNHDSEYAKKLGITKQAMQVRVCNLLTKIKRLDNNKKSS